MKFGDCMNVKTVEMKHLLPLIQENIANGAATTILVTGNSMRPLFHHAKDRAVLVPCDPNTLKRGDVPLYQRPDGQVYLHRIIGRNENGYRLIGDAQIDIEEGVAPEQIVAVMQGFYRKGKYIDCTAKGYRLYVKWWLAVRRIRPYLLGIYRRCTREVIEG